MYNKSIMVGRVCSDVTVKNLADGKQVANFRIETNDGRREFNTVNCFFQTAEVAKDLKEGDVVFLEGRVTTRRYINKNGDKVYATSINAARLQKVSESYAEGSEIDEDVDDF